MTLRGQDPVLKMIAGIAEPDLPDQCPTTRCSTEAAPMCRHNNGGWATFSRLRLFPHLTVRQNIAFARRSDGSTRNDPAMTHPFAVGRRPSILVPSATITRIRSPGGNDSGLPSPERW
jgi:ABC-type branched-subunit amino acid transport system ATPase component